MIIKNGLIHNAVEKDPFVADILIKEAKRIWCMGSGLDI